MQLTCMFLRKNYNISVGYCVANEHTAQSGGKVTVLTLVASPVAKCCSLMVEVDYEIKKFGLILRTLEQRQRSRQAIGCDDLLVYIVNP